MNLLKIAAEVLHCYTSTSNATTPSVSYFQSSSSGECNFIKKYATLLLVALVITERIAHYLKQNRRQKVFNRGALRFCGGLDTKN